MDLIYTDKTRKDVGVLQDYTFDLAFGSDENDFELTLDTVNHCCEPNCLVYIENTEYGGIIDGLGVTTADEKLVYRGRTWQGILASKILEPDRGKSHLTVSGDANQVLKKLISRIGLSELFTVSDEKSEVVINTHTFDRYVDAYSGIYKMLSNAGGKLNFRYQMGCVVVSVLPVIDYSKDEQFDSDTTEMNIETVENVVNHLICLGKGELTDRQVVHLYADKRGNISTKQTFRGLQEMTAVFDYPNAESVEELVEQGKVKLQEHWGADKVQADFTPDEDKYDVGDLIGAKETITGIVVVSTITKKIVTIREGEVNIQYKVGE